VAAIASKAAWVMVIQVMSRFDISAFLHFYDRYPSSFFGRTTAFFGRTTASIFDVRVRRGAQDARQIHQPGASGAGVAAQADMEHDGAVPSLLGAADTCGLTEVPRLGARDSLSFPERPESTDCVEKLEFPH
jgi:hypothetical protein